MPSNDTGPPTSALSNLSSVSFSSDESGGKYKKIEEPPDEEHQGWKSNVSSRFRLNRLNDGVGMFASIKEDQQQPEGHVDEGPASSAAVRALRCSLFMITFGCYALGFLALLFYAHFVEKHSRHLDFDHAMIPVALHVMGISIGVVLKAYYDMNPEVGHIEAMHIIIRSRLWLFPGVLGEHQLRRRLRSSVDEEQRTKDRENELLKKQNISLGHDLTFDMTSFLRQCQFPEFRCLLRAIDLYPWSSISSFGNADMMDELTAKSQAQVMRVFPMLEFLDVFSRVPAILNPMNHRRYVGNFIQYFRGLRSPASWRSFEADELATRYEEVEKDDITGDIGVEWFSRREPLPWGTLRLKNYESKFHDFSRNVNFVAVLVFSLSITGYLILIFGEWSFYCALKVAHEEYLEHRDGHPLTSSHNATGSPARNGTQTSERFPDDWAEKYQGLRDFQGTAFLLLFSLIPFAVQASALLAENAVVPLLVMDTMKYNVENFKEELNQYLTVLAVHKGTLAPPDSGMSAGTVEKKVAMTRDMALSWRMNFLLSELERDCSFVNSGVGLLVLNIICHLIPLNLFMFHPITPTDPCVPSWLIFFLTAQFFSITIIIVKAIQCNELTNEGVDSLLHDWQLKFNMIGWSGGFIGPTAEKYDTNFQVFVPQDPEGERQEDIKLEEDQGHTGYALKIQAEQHHRLTSIVKVLAHYEAENINPLQVVGITVTRDVVTIIFGFFGAQIIAFIMKLLDKTIDGMVQHTFMCHARAFAELREDDESEIRSALFWSLKTVVSTIGEAEMPER